MGETKRETVVDFNQIREKKLEEKRRKNERVFFRQLLGMYCVTGNNELKAIDLVDVSEDGCSFQVPHDQVMPWPRNDDPITIRLYFSQETYLPITVKIRHSRECIEEGRRHLRYGCSLEPGIASHETYRQFVRFLKLLAENAHKDHNGVTFFYI